MTHKQFDAYLAAGLLPVRGKDGRFPAAIVDALVAIKRLGKDVRSLPRRVLRLRADPERFPVPADKFRDALLSLVPAIPRPAQALAHVANFGVSPGVRGLRRVLPPVSTWEELIRDAPPALIEQAAPGWYAMVTLVPAYYAPAPSPLRKIPLEEQVLLYAILDLSRRRSEGTGLT